MIEQLDCSSRAAASATDLSPNRLAGILPNRLPSVDMRSDSREHRNLHVLCRSLAQLRGASTVGDRQRVSSTFRTFASIAKRSKLRHVRPTRNLSRHAAHSKARRSGHLPRAWPSTAPMASWSATWRAWRSARSTAFRSSCDFSLNATNELTVDYLQARGAERVTASYDLNRDQLLDLVAAVPPAWLEVVIHQHMPMFHMEHCVFCAVLSPGTNKNNCGRPCDVHEVKLRDRIGMEHPLHGRRRLPQHALQRRAAKRGRSRADVAVARPPPFPHRAVVGGRGRGDAGHRAVPRLARRPSQRQAGLAALQASNRVGVTRGTLEERRNPLAIL